MQLDAMLTNQSNCAASRSKIGGCIEMKTALSVAAAAVNGSCQ